MEKEIKDFLETGLRTKYGYRAATYKPTLAKFQSTSFSDYVRKVLMGVPLEGVELEEAYYEEEDESESEEEEEEEVEAGEDKVASPVQETDKGLKADASNNESPKTNAISPDPADVSKNTTKEEEEEEESTPGKKKEVGVNATKAKIGIQTGFCVLTVSSHASEALFHTHIEQEGKEEEEELDADDNNNKETNGSTSEPEEEEEEFLTRTRTRSKRTSKRGSTDMYSKNYQYSYKIPPKRTLKKKRPRPPPLEPDSVKLSDGIARITPPKGWWDKAGIGADTTGRGKPWRKGQTLGDMIIPSPIKQLFNGMGGIYDVTNLEQPPITVSEFRKKADDYRFRQLGRSMDTDESSTHLDFLARKFWKRLGPTMESPHYGADMEGSLFDGDEASGWNVDQLESCLGLLGDKANLPGVTSAYLYFGMWSSVFSAHTEDMHLCSINYLHAGAPKYWYAIAQEDSGRFETLMASMFPRQNRLCGDFLRHKRSILSPQLLQKAGITFTTQLQRAGDIMITFPGSYHFGK